MIDWGEFTTVAISQSQVDTLLKVDDHPTKDFDITPKYLFNFDPEGKS